MSQGFDKLKPTSGTTTFGVLYSELRANADALLSAHAGTSEPTYKEVGVIWAKLNASGYIEKCYQYTGDVTITTDGYVGWAEISLSHAGIGAELINARGTKSSLDERLDVAFNEDGTLKASVTETTAGEWLDPQFSWTSSYLSSTTFKVSGDQTDIYTAKRRLKVSLSGSTVYTEVSSSSYSSPDTTVTVADAVLTDPIVKVEHGIIQPISADTSLPQEYVTLSSAQEITGVKTFSAAPLVDTINEKTAAAGVTIDGVKLKDSEVTTDVINEKTADAGVTVDGVKLKDGGLELLIRDQSRNLVVQSNSTNPTYQMDIDADEVILQNSSGLAVKLSSINLTVDITVNGINGCVRVSKTGTASAVGTAVTGVGTSFTTEFAVGDVLWFDTKAEGRRISAITNNTSLTLESAFTVDPTSQNISRGGEAPNTWYYIWILYDTNTQGSVLDTSPTSPQVPSGYTYKGLFGSVFNDAVNNFSVYHQAGDFLHYTNRRQIILNGTASVYTSLNLSNHAPPIAREVEMEIQAHDRAAGTYYEECNLSYDGSSPYLTALDGNGGTGEVYKSVSSGVLPLKTSQTLWYKAGANSQVTVYLLGYKL